MVYLISYDLNRPGQNYDRLYDAIKSYGTWCHPLDSTWLIKTSRNADKIYEHLKQHIDVNDHILVIKVTADCQGYLPQKVCDWINEQIKQNEYA